MWFLQVDILLRLLLAAALMAVAAYALRRCTRGWVYGALLLAADVALLLYVSPALAGLYSAYTLLTFGLCRLLLHVRRFRRPLFVLFCLLCVTPVFCQRLIPDFPAVLVLVGMAYNMLKAVDALFFVYYGEQKIGLLAYANFLLFFPVLTAGPIFRYRDFERCYLHPQPLTAELTERCVKRFIRGMFKKVVVVALLSTALTQLLAAPAHWYVSLLILAASYAFIYLDLSGYSDIAIAIGGVAGFDVPENFNAPLTAASFTVFWRKWHITLSNWIREHVFVLLNGKRLRPLTAGLVAFATMLIMSLWHQFTLYALLSGCYMGLILLVENLCGWSTVNRRRMDKRLFWLRCLIVTGLFAVNSLFFTMDLAQAAAVLKGLVTL